MTFEAGDVVVVPFPFTDKQAGKRRPALVLSDTADFPAGHIVLAMITSHGHAPWPLDISIQDALRAGLNAPSMVRMKLFTLDNRLIVRKAGTLTAKDAGAVAANLKKLLGKSLRRKGKVMWPHDGYMQVYADHPSLTPLILPD